MYDLIIIGTGSMGSAGAYYASRKGLKVLMMDAHHPPHEQGAHHGATRLYRYIYHNDAYQRLLNRAAQLWPELEATHNTRLLQRCGVINIAPADSADLLAKRQMADQYALPYEWLDAEQIQSRWPGIAVPDSYLGLYENQAGYLYSEKTVECLIREAQKHGARTAFNTPVTRICRDEQSLCVYDAHGQCHRGRKLAITAGTWSNLIQGLPTALAFAPERKTFAWYHAPRQYHEQQGFPGFTVETTNGTYYGFPDHGQGLKVGRHDQGEIMHNPDQRYAYGHYSSDREDTDRFLQTFMPQSGEWHAGKVCSYDRTASEDFLIGSHPEDSDIMLLAGFSGHGFKFTPAIGEWIAMFAANESLLDHSTFFNPFYSY